MAYANPRPRHDPSKNLVGFVIGDVSYALPIASVREIVKPLTIVELPSSPSAVVGVADYRGEVVPVVDLRVRFGLPSLPTTRRTKWILVDVGGRLVAVVVDQVTDVFGTSGGELRPAPPMGGGEDVRGIAGVVNSEPLLVFGLDVERFAELTEPLALAGGYPPEHSTGGGDGP